MAKAKADDPQKLIFRNVKVRFFDVRRKKEGPPFVRLHLSADLSAPIRLAMGWSIGEGQSKGSFAGAVSCTHLILTPNQKALPGMGAHEVQFGCDEAGDFAFVEHYNDEGMVQSTDLQFIVRSSDPEAAAKLDEYWRTVLAGDAEMRLAYTMIGKRNNGTSEDDDEDKVA